MQHCKQSDFNPLDILATAAALKQTDKPETKQKIVIVKPKEGVKIINPKHCATFSCSTNEKKTNTKPIGLIRTTSFVEDGVKKVKLTISSELEKMLNEHNYGSIQKVSSGNKTVLKLPDVLSLGNDKKVIVKLVDKSGDQVNHDQLLAGVNSTDKNSLEETTTPNPESGNEGHKENKSDQVCDGENKETLSEHLDTKLHSLEESNLLIEDLREDLNLDNEKDELKHVDSEESLTDSTGRKESCSSYTVPACKPVQIDDFDVCNERIDSDIRSPVYEDIDFNESHKTPPNDQTILESNTNSDQILNIKHSIEEEENHDQDIALLASTEYSISTWSDKENKILEKDGKNQYGDNETLPGKIDTGANNIDRCDMGKSQVLDKVETYAVQEKQTNIEDTSEESPSVDSYSSRATFSMQDHEYAEKYWDDSSEKRNDKLHDLHLVNEFSQDSGFSDSGLSPDGLESRTYRRDSPSLIPVKTDMLPSFDLNDVNKARDAIVALVNSNAIPVVPHETNSPTSSTKTSPKVGKFSIGTFASVCNSTLGLQSPEKSQIAFGQRIATSLLSNNISQQNKSESAVTCVQNNSTEHIEHDHDYSLPYHARPSNIPFSVQKVNKEIAGKGKTKERKSDGNEKRTKRSGSSETKEDKTFDLITGESEKKSNKSEKLAEFLKNSTSDSKLKIQGSYKDDFVYFLNTNFRSRRRASQDIPPSIPPDKIFVPLPKPGDIIVPHLTNEDLEAIRLGKHSTLSNGPHTNGSLSSAATQPSLPATVSSALRNQTNGVMTDIESGIINTILSMETEPCADTTDPVLYGNGNENFNINFSDQLTPEQMEILYSAVDQVQSIDSTSSDKENTGDNETIQGKGVTSDLNGEPACVEIKTGSPEARTPKDTAATSDKSLPVNSDSHSSEQLDLLNDDMKLFPSTPDVSKNKSEETDAPGIMTVSMFWNDLPAIMLENLPYLRLVDIHKQILPAKDTGILKKRCQLLGIVVKNCSEMQRYFLVQYGRAFNSKSNLIISKVDAEFLIGYYVNPVTKLPRSSEDHPQPKVKPTKVSRPRSRPPSRTDSEKTRTLVPQKKPPVIAEPPPPVPLGRTRHKKINFLELLKGDSNSNSTENSVTEHVEEKKSEGSISVVVVQPPVGWKKSDSSVKKVDVGKKTVKRLHSGSEIYKKKSEECQTMDSMGDDDIENRNLTWLCKKRQKIPLKVNKKVKKPGSLKVKWTIFNKASRKNLIKKKKQREVLSVVHKDILPNNSHLNNIQPGNVFMDLYNNENSLCVRCCTCNKIFSIDAFLSHQHDNGGDGKLISVVNPQSLSLRDASESQKKIWRNFQLKRKRFNNNKITSVQNGLPKIQIVERQNDLEKRTLIVKPPSNKSLRISSRKRKQKQLYPIENYSYSSVGKHEGHDTSPSPNKIIKVSDALADNVVTESNGPILTSFTALEHDL
ncbi:uncharacterized protein LOC127733113 isoform X2 [Mytilus californianus]|uniref:uncharacterized protein LOC127733113 isoform X2 n=1 Tax=Mytilus californianus TaxID=6549 RepID=UPI0022478489|nr:uncharacterized protein LOC127733113 isoform X2 [Mytilus californianus]